MSAKLREEIECVINRCNADAGSDTADYILADYLVACLGAFDKAVKSRDVHNGNMRIGTVRRLINIGSSD